MPVVDAIDVVEPLRPVVQGLGRAGEVTIGLTPAPPSSVEPRGIAPMGARPGARPAVVPPKVEGAIVVPDAVPPAPHEVSADVPAEPMPALSKVEEELETPAVPDVPAPAELKTGIPVLAHGIAAAVGSNSIGLRPPGASSVAPRGIPTGPADDVVPGTPSGEVDPIAGVVGMSGAIWAKLTPALSSNSSNPTARLFNATSHCHSSTRAADGAP
jgi:hypothetical protein